ncbi:MAG: RNA polymerase sigma factor [Candidatus Riflebacteria bacterium]|nr:RNA polymerase sigma factor [Candidatus Riflebacteria bacterium]
MSYHNLEIDTEFIACLRRLDERAFGKLFHACSGLVYSIAMGLLGDRQAAEDALQEIFFKVYKALPDFEGEKLTSWIGRIAQNHCFDMLRQAKRAVVTSVKPIDDLDISQLEPVSDEFPDFLNSLSLLEREVVILKKVEGLSYKEISQLTGKKEGTLRNIMLKSLQLLRGKLDEK